MTARLPGKRAHPASQRNEGTWIALVFVLGVVGGLMAMILLILPDIFGLLLVLAAFGGFIALHYFTWGRWLMRKSAQSTESLPSQSPPPVSPSDAAQKE